MEFLYPNVLWMIFLPVVLLILLISTNKNNLQIIFNKEVLDKLTASKNGLDAKTRNFLTFTALILMVFALSRPVFLQKEKEVEQNLIPVVVALDVSKSMLSNDIYPNRLELSKKKIKNFLQKSKNSAVGVLLFAKSPFILSPITQDFTTLLYMIDNMNSGLNFDNGSNIMGMLEASNKLLKDHESKNIILFSDGGNNTTFDKEIEYIQKNNIKLYIIATATKNGAPIPTPEGYLTDKIGNIVTVKLNEKIKDLAIDSGGGYIDYTIDDSDVKAIIDELISNSQKESMDTKKIKIYTELFYYPLALGLFFLFISIYSFPQRKSNNLIVILLLSLYIDNGYSGILDFKTLDEAKKAYESENYKYSSNQYKQVVHNSEGFYNLGNSLYKEGKYYEAIKAYEKVVTSDKEFEAQKLHNMGNSYVKINNLEKAKEMYENALKRHYDKQTKENLDKVNNALNKNDQDKQKDEDSKEQEQNQQNDKNNKSEQEKNDKKKQNDKNKSDEMKKNENSKKQEQKDNNFEKKDNTKNQDKNDLKNSMNNDQNNHKEKAISELEEKKWMELLKDQKTPIMLHKMETNSKGDESSTPW